MEDNKIKYATFQLKGDAIFFIGIPGYHTNIYT